MDDKIKSLVDSGWLFRSMMEFRANDSGNGNGEQGDVPLIVEGYACTFNQPYELLNLGDYAVYEQIDPAAFDECDMGDCCLRFDHEGKVYARTRNNTLQLSVDNVGLFIRADLSKASDGKSMYDDIKNGLIDRMSFAFTIAEDEQKVTENHETGAVKVLRTITKIRKLYDVAPVGIPANDATSISARNYADGAISVIKAEHQKRARKQKQINVILALGGI